MQRALLGGIIISTASALIGVFLVLKRLSLLGDSLAHASFGGIALGFVTGWNPLLTALAFVTLASLGIDRLVNKLKVYGESAIALMLSFGMALALLLIGIAKKMDYNIFSYLFGSILTINSFDIALAATVLALILIFYFFNYKILLYSAFNQDIALVRNKRTKLIDKLFIMLSAVTIVISIRAVGILLISALLVIPALIGLRLSKSFKSTIFIAILSSICGVLLGIFLAYYFDLPAGGTIVMSLLFLFVLSLFFGRK
ncbi:metal ABC transporter permease [Candidatus Woesearchaeota archaeon]|nr:metal ABC transporter permease [Candidatus Woesearchaeota archaeon]